ncbi:hypothetical protein CC86DRAFT_456409 [Ophiobolus disseminans]|uniref:Uncharacterized protein n=1 Tax=Ophiobolus disseminans TaxID=1469910 RepID=A0A6A6ZX62_9PLEO|nr:hypothetical protein CC86DRAFT_456409 [Ophiobolus disseminans]
MGLLVTKSSGFASPFVALVGDFHHMVCYCHTFHETSWRFLVTCCFSSPMLACRSGALAARLEIGIDICIDQIRVRRLTCQLPPCSKHSSRRYHPQHVVLAFHGRGEGPHCLAAEAARRQRIVNTSCIAGFLFGDAFDVPNTMAKTRWLTVDAYTVIVTSPLSNFSPRSHYHSLAPSALISGCRWLSLAVSTCGILPDAVGTPRPQTNLPAPAQRATIRLPLTCTTLTAVAHYGHTVSVPRTRRKPSTVGNTSATPSMYEVGEISEFLSQHDEHEQCMALFRSTTRSSIAVRIVASKFLGQISGATSASAGRRIHAGTGFPDASPRESSPLRQAAALCIGRFTMNAMSSCQRNEMPAPHETSRYNTTPTHHNVYHELHAQYAIRRLDTLNTRVGPVGYGRRWEMGSAAPIHFCEKGLARSWFVNGSAYHGSAQTRTPGLNQRGCRSHGSDLRYSPPSVVGFM